jgi:hypothetical protein
LNGPVVMHQWLSTRGMVAGVMGGRQDDAKPLEERHDGWPVRQVGPLVELIGEDHPWRCRQERGEEQARSPTMGAQGQDGHGQGGVPVRLHEAVPG